MLDQSTADQENEIIDAENPIHRSYTFFTHAVLLIVRAQRLH